MMPSPFEADLLAARIARIKYLIDSLETTLPVPRPDQQEIFRKLREEMAAARLTLRPSEGRPDSDPPA